MRSRLSVFPDPCLCIIGAVALIHSLYGHVQAYLQQPVSHPSSRQTVPLACAPVKLLQASQNAAIDSSAGSGAGINGGMGDGGRGTACKHAFTLLDSEWNNVYFWEWESVKEMILKPLKTRLKRLRLIHGKDK